MVATRLAPGPEQALCRGDGSPDRATGRRGYAELVVTFVMTLWSNSGAGETSAIVLQHRSAAVRPSRMARCGGPRMAQRT
jgi:hypothetical protein